MDKDSCKVYRAMGLDHFAVILNPDPRQPNGYKAVKKSPDGKGWVDENGQFYQDAEPLPF